MLFPGDFYGILVLFFLLAVNLGGLLFPFPILFFFITILLLFWLAVSSIRCWWKGSCFAETFTSACWIWIFTVARLACILCFFVLLYITILGFAWCFCTYVAQDSQNCAAAVLIPSRMHYWRIQYALIDIFVESEQHCSAQLVRFVGNHHPFRWKWSFSVKYNQCGLRRLVITVSLGETNRYLLKSISINVSYTQFHLDENW